MDEDQRAVARQCLHGAENGTMSFPQIIGNLLGAGFDGYLVDFRLAQSTYYLTSGEGIELSASPVAVPIAPQLDVEALQGAIREAQTQAPGYTYRGFCERAKAAGCAGYVASLSGRRVLYFGCMAETHVEHFPQ